MFLEIGEFSAMYITNFDGYIVVQQQRGNIE